MEEQDQGRTGLLDVETDALVLCASKLNLKDLAQLALSCKRLQQVAYADPVWNIQGRIRWPLLPTSSGVPHFIGGRGAYLARLLAAEQFRFHDPVEWSIIVSPLNVLHVLLDDETVYAAHGSNIIVARRTPVNALDILSTWTLRDHNAKVTCMRLFSADFLGTSRSSMVGRDKVLVTSSADHSVRIWGKVRFALYSLLLSISFQQERVVRTFRGHNGPVTVIADKLVGDRILATGSADCTVRLWNLVGSHRRRTPLQATLHGHESYVKDLTAAGHNPSLLVSAARDSKLRVWDVNTETCVGSARGSGHLTSLHCVGCVCYISGGDLLSAIDLRTLQPALQPTEAHAGGVITTAVSHSGWSLCTGGNDSTAKLWDTRMLSKNSTPVAVLGPQNGPVHCLHVDNSKIVTGGRLDSNMQVWDPSNGALVNTLEHDSGMTALACKGSRVAVATITALAYRDFSNSAIAVENVAESGASKFWAT